ncbi:uncharacterized protein MELLADRAFT_84499 [Melampsora larici-populina 98AG31]|uniref:Uncharacterized protein n=1 Tax=Melampsora larici-populina (strain 98AG31 / pathotype 3-4-7) TaxID=747676 RepID=F4SC84_MELLP|nr:uncharacterized protein MELLADRAFT_84499 [Melampsora larici-populina 98AG31]EGF97746.1 hypothetical protein MELLADRAFT_84499 [Melampsora larici-populina 98AG31]
MLSPTTSNTIFPMPPPPLITTLPDPNPLVTKPFDHRKQLDKFVKEFAPQHGYGIIIGHSGRDPNLYCKYQCHRSGKPAKPKARIGVDHVTKIESEPPKKSRSIKIGCPFEMRACFDHQRQTWTLVHKISHHNHEPMEIVIPVITTIISTSSIQQTTPTTEQPQAREASHESKETTPETSIQSQLVSINEQILSMEAPQQDEMIKSIRKLLNSVCSVPEDEISNNIRKPNNEIALDILDDMEYFQSFHQPQLPDDVGKGIDFAVALMDPEKSPTTQSRINDALDVTLNLNQHSFDSLDSFQYEDLIRSHSQPMENIIQNNQTHHDFESTHDTDLIAQNGHTFQHIDSTNDYITKVQNNHTPHNFDRTNENNINTAHDPSSQHNATNISSEVISAIPSTQQIPSANDPLQTHPVTKQCNTSTVKDNAQVSPRRTRSKVAAVHAEEEVQSGLNRRTRSALSGKKRKCNS